MRVDAAAAAVCVRVRVRVRDGLGVAGGRTGVEERSQITP
jgi:hypothetical protein